MNTSQLKKYAPVARRGFIEAVRARAAVFGLTPDGAEPITEEGDLALIGDKPFPRLVASLRRKLEERIQRQGFDQVIEAMAYTWFNRLVAIRYMELHGYLDHGRRVLSHPDKEAGFEILDDCTEIELPELDREQVIELKLAGNKDEELYRLLLLGQCRALHQAMPFLFEAIEDESELLLPDNLTKTNSLIRRLVDDIPEDDWQNVEIIGWLYQFYISEKKDQVIGKVVKSEDIPAATQLFTPNWIVKYLVQNSLGAQWLATYPESSLKAQMEYYIEPAEQTEEVQAQLDAITPDSLDPEQITLIDPACGSGHILVEAYELFKAIYLERGYRRRDIPQLILEKNLYGLEICPRAAQLTGFSLMMKGRADDRRLFQKDIELNVLALKNSRGFDAKPLAEAVDLSDYGLTSKDLEELQALFEHATTFGSLIQVPEGLAVKLQGLRKLGEAQPEDLFAKEAIGRLRPLVRQTEMLADQYDNVVANPPYMGLKGLAVMLKRFVTSHYVSGKSDLYTPFVSRGGLFSANIGRSAMVTLDGWMFLSSFADLRARILSDRSIETLVHVGWNCFPQGHTYNRGVVFVARNYQPNMVGVYLNLSDVPATVDKNHLFLKRLACKESFFLRAKSNFKKIPGQPIAYWISEHVGNLFRDSSLNDGGDARRGLQTGDKNRFIRHWTEPDLRGIEWNYLSNDEIENSRATWFYFNNGGDYRKWYGNLERVVRWQNDGALIKGFDRSIIPNESRYFEEAICWPAVTSREPPFRIHPSGVIPGDLSPCYFGHSHPKCVLAYLNSVVARFFLRVLNPTLHTQTGDVAKLPDLDHRCATQATSARVQALLNAAKRDWDSYERSWHFQSLPLLTASSGTGATLESSYEVWITKNKETIAEMQRLEEENNRLFIDAYGLQDELTPDVPLDEITLTVNPAYRYGGKLTEEERWTRFREDTMEELISYAIGCMMGRYSLDEPGLIYAHGGNEGFDPSRYGQFPADDDGIIPLTDTEWFGDDACNRLIEFLSVAWDKANLEDNVTFLAANLSPRKSESSRETIRRYLCDKFFKDHLQAYKKRPIYWLFSSGKQKAFQCLVYLHRYNEGTLARMRTEYVIPLQGLIRSRIEQRDTDISAATSTAHRKRLEKERDKLVKQRVELQEFDEKLRHFADQRIRLDLDDGVKVNYGKFGDLLAEVKSVHGKKPP